MTTKYFKKLALLMGTAVGSSAFAGGGGSGWTQCYAKELGYIYSFSGYTQSLVVGKTITVFTNSPSTKEYGYYRINSIDLSQNVGVVELSHVPDTQSNASKDTDFGKMKIEYFSNSALKDIKVTFTKDGLDNTSNVNCITD
jgi:hypothetical protein